MDISCSKFYPNQMKNIENVGKFSFTPYVKYAFHFTNFHETQAWSTTFCEELL